MQRFAYRSGFLIFGLLTFVCATSNACPDTEDEAVSICRAKQACGGDKASTRIGFALSGFGSGMNHTRNEAMDRFERCVDRDLEVQKSNAEVKPTPSVCTTVKIDEGTYKTTCKTN